MKRFILWLILIPLLALGSVAQSRNQVSPRIQNEIIQQLTRDGEITTECVREAGGPRKALGISLVDLNRDGRPEFIVDLLISCGAGDGYKWIFRKTSSGLELLLKAGGPRTRILPLRSYTNGYRDIAEDALHSLSGASVRTIYKFDGKRYREIK